MPTCRVCKKSFRYDDEVGYAVDQCGPICDGIEAGRRSMLPALQAALAHVEELRDAWMRGAIDERDGLGGTRSNRNCEVETALRAAIAKAQPE